MELTARGFSHNMGDTVIGNAELHEISINETDVTRKTFARTYTLHKFNDTSLTWSADLRFTGHYLINLSFSREDIAHLFQVTFGSTVTPAILEQAGLRLKGVKPSEKQIREAIRQMTLAEFLSIVTANKDADDQAA